MLKTSKGLIYLITRKIIPALILLVVGFAIFQFMFLSRPTPEKADTSAKLQQVTTTVSQPYNGPIFVEANGMVVPHREIIMAAEVAGTIATKTDACQSGKWVAKDTDLIVIDKEDFQLTVKRLEAEVTQAKTQLKELEAEIQNATSLVELVKREWEIQQRELARLERLRNSISASEIDQASIAANKAENAYLNQQHQLNLLTTRRSRLEAARDLALLQQEKAELDLKRTDIKAPSDGVIVMEDVEQGSYVQPGTRLLVFEDTTRAEVEFNLTVDEVYWIMQDKRALGLPSPGQSEAGFRLPPIENVVIEFEVEGETIQWEGRLDGFAGYGVDQQTRNVPCRVIVDDPHKNLGSGVGVLRRGMFVRVHIPVEPSVQLLGFPERALQAQNRIWVVREFPKEDDPKVKYEGISQVEVRIAGRLPGSVAQGYDQNFKISAQRTSSTSQIDDTEYWIIALMQKQQGADAQGNPTQKTSFDDNSEVVDSPLSLPYEGMEIKVVGEGDSSGISAEETEQQSVSTSERKPNAS